MSNFYLDVIQKDPRFHQASPVSDPMLLEPVMRAAVIAIIAEGKSLGFDYRIEETYRSSELQLHYYNTGASRLREVGCHHFGIACDLHWYVNGVFVTDGSKYQMLRYLAEKHGLLCGGDWGQPTIDHTFRDYDHVQRCPISRQNNLFAGRWYPDDTYSPLPDLHRTKPTAAKMANGAPMPWFATQDELDAA